MMVCKERGVTRSNSQIVKGHINGWWTLPITKDSPIEVYLDYNKHENNYQIQIDQLIWEIGEMAFTIIKFIQTLLPITFINLSI